MTSQTLSLHARHPAVYKRSHHPLAATCPVHLRRICGTCAHWTGSMRGVGQCPLYQTTGAASASAVKCADWVRKTADQRIRRAPSDSTSPDSTSPTIPRSVPPAIVIDVEFPDTKMHRHLNRLSGGRLWTPAMDLQLATQMVAKVKLVEVAMALRIDPEDCITRWQALCVNRNDVGAVAELLVALRLRAGIAAKLDMAKAAGGVAA